MWFEGQEYPYEIVSRERYDIGRIHVVKDTLRIDGELYPYTFAKTRDGVCIFPVCDEGIVVIEQYRHSLNRWMVEVPAGAVDPGEQPEEAARRELLEETGYVANQMVNMGRYCENEGVSSSYCTLFFARCRKETQPRCEKTELIRTKVLSAEEFELLVKENGFHLLIGLVAWYRARENGML